jgi:hypothetical protein
MEKGNSTSQKIDYKNPLRFQVFHEEAANETLEATTPIIGPWTKTRTWNRIRKYFSWVITRPELGHEVYKTKCEYCGKVLKVDVLSIEYMKNQIVQRRNMKTIGLLLLLASILIVVLGLFSLIPESLYLIMYGSIFGVIIGLFMFVGGSDKPSNSGYFEKEGLTIKYWRGDGDHPFNGHYIEEV